MPPTWGRKWVENMLLAVENLNVFYGGIHALKGISCAVGEGEIVALIGANGAGKSSTLRTICGSSAFWPRLRAG